MKFDKLYNTLLEKASTHSNAYVFDFDQTLADTGAKIGIVKDDQIVKKLTSKQFNTYVLKPGETFEFSEFTDGNLILNKSKLLPYFYVMKNIYKNIKHVDNKDRIYILTARSSVITDALQSLLARHNILIPMENIFAIGDTLKQNQTIAEKKKEILHKLSEHYNEVTFFDDDERNIELAKDIGSNVRTRHIKFTEQKLEEIAYDKLIPISKTLDYVSCLFKRKVTNVVKDHDKIGNWNLNRLLTGLNASPAIKEFLQMMDRINVACAKAHFDKDVVDDDAARKLFIDKINEYIKKFNDNHLPFGEVVLVYKELEKMLTTLRMTLPSKSSDTIIISPSGNKSVGSTSIKTKDQYVDNSNMIMSSYKKAKIIVGIMYSSRCNWSDKFMAICILLFGMRIDFN